MEAWLDFIGNHYLVARMSVAPEDEDARLLPLEAAVCDAFTAEDGFLDQIKAHSWHWSLKWELRKNMAKDRNEMLSTELGIIVDHQERSARGRFPGIVLGAIDAVGRSHTIVFFAIFPVPWFGSFRIVPGTLVLRFFASRPVPDIGFISLFSLTNGAKLLLSVLAGC